ncbi:SRPBCC family protein [Gillisia marina]|uniref:SRPBCC family protein n=1 Tax=Gillisia marina TaxID=1167637 RepID=UPI00029A020F|nr:SRPBCC domain-containing protein [Gillisia marina]
MKVLKFSTDINAPREKVWDVLWTEETYKKWIKAFSKGEDLETISEWKEGEPITFMDSKGNGMQSRINKMAPPEMMVFQHLREIKNREVQSPTPESKKWEGALESYQLTEKNGSTSLLVKMDTVKEHEDFFNEAFPEALNTIKNLAEEKSRTSGQAHEV